MPRLVEKQPKYRMHKASGQAVVSLSGKEVYLGPYSKSHRAPSWQKYDRLVGEWKARGRQLPAGPAIR